MSASNKTTVFCILCLLLSPAVLLNMMLGDWRAAFWCLAACCYSDSKFRKFKQITEAANE